MNRDDARMQAALGQIARALVAHPDQVEVRVVDGRRATRFEIRCAPEDRGQVIGKEGMTIRSLRILSAISAHRHHRRFEVEVPG